MQRIEWITLTFFGAMFITMECLARLGLITWIGSQTERLILMVDEELRLALAVFIILWVSHRTLAWLSCPIAKSFFILNFHISRIDFCFDLVSSRFDTSYSDDGQNCCFVGSKQSSQPTSRAVSLCSSLWANIRW